MKIESVKKTLNGYLVNGSMLVPNNNNNIECLEVLEWIKQGGVVEPEFSKEQLLLNSKEKKLAEINQFHSSNEVKTLKIKIGQAQTYIGLTSEYRYLIDEQISLLEIRIKRGEVNPVWNYRNGITLQLNLEQLSNIRIYIGNLVDFNYNVKRNHEIAVLALTNIEAVTNYDFTKNYKLNQVLDFA